MKRWDSLVESYEAINRQQLLVAALSLLYGTGLRRGELERLNVGTGSVSKTF